MNKKTQRPITVHPNDVDPGRWDITIRWNDWQASTLGGLTDDELHALGIAIDEVLL